MSKKKSKSKKSSKKVTEEVVAPAIEQMEASSDSSEEATDALQVLGEDSAELNLEFASDDDEDQTAIEEATEDKSTETLEFEMQEDADTVGIEMESDDEVADASDEYSDADQMEAAAESEEAADQVEQGEDLMEDSSEGSSELDNSELGSFESAQIEDLEMVTQGELRSIIESILFTSDKPISIAVIKQAFKGTTIKSKDIREALHQLAAEYNDSSRGFTLEEIAGGFQLRTKPENLKYLRQSVKARPFKLSGPALEVLSIVAYKQPTTKHQIDEIRGVESGHLLRALMEKHLITFGERSDLPGKPMFYETTRKFLEIFGLRNLQELPSLHEIDQLIPEGIGGDEPKKETLSDLTGQLSQETAESYSVGEDELLKITDELSTITTSSEFFEQEKQRQREKRDQERAQDILERQIVGEEIDPKDLRWLERYEASKLSAAQGSDEVEFVTEGILEGAASEELPEIPDPMLGEEPPSHEL